MIECWIGSWVNLCLPGDYLKFNLCTKVLIFIFMLDKRKRVNQLCMHVQR